jgi:uncharacterized protein
MNNQIFSLLVKPVSGRCNCRCSYCFYLPGHNPPVTDPICMAPKVLEHLIQTYLATPQPVYSFTWQGGEPLLAGLDFYRMVLEMQTSYASPGSVIQNSVQTNGMLLNSEFAALFKEYKILVGISIDGPRDVHNQYRKTTEGNGTHGKVIEGLELLQEYDISTNAMVLVSRSNVEQATRVYEYLVNLGCYHQQYIPCVEFDKTGKLEPWAITGDAWGQFLVDLFNQWHPVDCECVSIRNFETIQNMHQYGEATICSMGNSCKSYLVVEHDGSVYPCDYFVEQRLRLGSILDSDWSYFFETGIHKRFAAGKAEFSSRCLACAYLEYCAGDCQKYRVMETTGRNPGTTQEVSAYSILCDGTRRFFNECLDKLIQ